MNDLVNLSKRMSELERVRLNLEKCKSGGVNAGFQAETQALALSYTSGKNREKALAAIEAGLAESIETCRRQLLAKLT